MAKFSRPERMPEHLAYTPLTTKEYTKDLTGGDERKDDVGVVQAVDIKPTDQITNEQRQKIIGQLDYVQRILQQGYFMDAQGRRQELTEDHRRQLSDFMNQADAYLNPYRDKKAAHGGRIDKALEGRSRDI